MLHSLAFSILGYCQFSDTQRAQSVSISLYDEYYLYYIFLSSIFMYAFRFFVVDLVRILARASKKVRISSGGLDFKNLTVQNDA